MYSSVIRILIVSSFMLLLVKTVDTIIMASTDSPDSILVAESLAKTEDAPAKPAEQPLEKKAEKPSEKPADGKPADGAGDKTAPAEGAHGEEKSGDEHGKKGEEKKPEERPVSYDEVKTYTDAELEVLQRLSERRDRLLKWEKDLQVKENVLKITEEKIDTKIDELRKLKKEVEISLAEYRKEEDAKTKSLVKIYEGMKPKNAADILSKMKPDDMVPLISKMKEKSAAEILAKMDPNIAKDVTTRLNALGRIRSTAPAPAAQFQFL